VISTEPLVIESRIEALMRKGLAEPRFLQGVFPFLGAGFYAPALLNPDLTYAVPKSAKARLLYVRAGNLSEEMIYLCPLRDGKPIRYFPIRARGDIHVTLAIQDDIPGGSQMELHFAAPDGLAGSVVLDVGFIEMYE
jgi:assimilatory nitrate reductase catalytic subunit